MKAENLEEYQTFKAQFARSIAKFDRPRFMVYEQDQLPNIPRHIYSIAIWSSRTTRSRGQKYVWYVVDEEDSVMMALHCTPYMSWTHLQWTTYLRNYYELDIRIGMANALTCAIIFREDIDMRHELFSELHKRIVTPKEFKETKAVWS